MTLKTIVVTSATGEPIALADMKEHINITTTDDNDYITNLGIAARQYVEMVTNRKLMPQTWAGYWDCFPYGKEIQIPHTPLRSIPSTGFVYTNSAGASTTFSSTAWGVDIASEPGRIVLTYGDSWPSVTLGYNNPIAITFNCGYAGSSAVPQQMKEVMYLLVANWYDNREAVSIVYGGKPFKMPYGVNQLNQYKVFE